MGNERMLDTDFLFLIRRPDEIGERLPTDLIDEYDVDADWEACWDEVDAELRGEVCGLIQDESGISLDEAQLESLLAHDTSLLRSIVEFGVDDTEVASQIAHAVSNALLGRSWPTFGERTDLAAFVDDLRAAAVHRGYAVFASSPSNPSLA